MLTVKKKMCFLIISILLVSSTFVGCTSEEKNEMTATYELKNETDGFAAGTLSIMLPEEHSVAEIIPYWGNEDGKLEGYTSLAHIKVKDNILTKEIEDNILIPSEATKLLLYIADSEGNISEDCVEVKLPEGAASEEFGKPLFEFQAISDIHLNSTFEKEYKEYYNNNFVTMLNDIESMSPDSIGIFISGDIADHGYESEYEQLLKLHSSVSGVPPYYLAVGNHDLYGDDFDAQIALFLKYATLPDGSKPEKSHYDFWLNDYHFVFLGNDKLVHYNEQTTLTTETLQWLRETLSENRDEKRPTFLFLHQPLYNTVAGSLQGQGGNGVATDSEQPLRDVLKDFPEVVMFNGHSHWPLDAAKTMNARTEKLPTIFNTAAVAYLYSDYYNISGEKLYREDGTFYSQGYYVRVYKDKLLVLGREFSSGEWVSSAQFYVDLDM